MTSRLADMDLILDGVNAFENVLNRAGYPMILHAVAAHTVFLPPETVDVARASAASCRSCFGHTRQAPEGREEPPSHREPRTRMVVQRSGAGQDAAIAWHGVARAHRKLTSESAQITLGLRI